MSWTLGRANKRWVPLVLVAGLLSLLFLPNLAVDGKIFGDGTWSRSEVNSAVRQGWIVWVSVVASVVAIAFFSLPKDWPVGGQRASGGLLLVALVYPAYLLYELRQLRSDIWLGSGVWLFVAACILGLATVFSDSGVSSGGLGKAPPMLVPGILALALVIVMVLPNVSETSEGDWGDSVISTMSFSETRVIAGYLGFDWAIWIGIGAVAVAIACWFLLQGSPRRRPVVTVLSLLGLVYPLVLASELSSPRWDGSRFSLAVGIYGFGIACIAAALVASLGHSKDATSPTERSRLSVTKRTSKNLDSVALWESRSEGGTHGHSR